MAGNTFLCHKCGNIFRSPTGACVLRPEDIECPQCGGTAVKELPSWVPLGSDLSEGPVAWEYECQHCHHNFKLPVPDSPSEEKNIRCPACDGKHIHRLTAAGYEPLYCG